MESWALLLALTGVQSDASQGKLTFNPIRKAATREDYFQTFWSNGVAWGIYLASTDSATVAVQHHIQVLGGEPASIILPHGNNS